MMYLPRNVIAFLLAAIVSLAATIPNARAEEGSVDAFAAWEGHGQSFRTGETNAIFVGSFDGILFFMTEGGHLDAAAMTCPGMVEFDLTDGRQTGEGRCILTTSTGETVFARWLCSGIHGVGCAGQFSFTGGTGVFEGISGDSDFVLRSALREIVLALPDGVIEEYALGVVYWPKLNYKLP
jgi:hypothetical protein